MTAINITAEVDIAAEPTDVAGVMFDPAREPEWLEAVTSVDVVDAAIAPGARVRHTGSVKGFSIAWTSTVESFQFPHMLTLRVAEEKFTGTVKYVVGRADGGAVARVVISGQAALPMFFPASMVMDKAREALIGYLARLKQVVEK